jgi:hypothetical protein
MTEATSWRAPLVAAICLATAAGISNAPLGAGLRSALILALAALAVGVSLAQTMGLRRASRGIRALILVPLGFCLVAAVVLILEARFRAGLVLR